MPSQADNPHHASRSGDQPTDARHMPWWRSAVIYQIYPWSFQDSNSDGIGDLPGIIQRLDYLNDGQTSSSHSLGVDAIWLSPVYPSPMKDFGYDVSDYCAIDPRFGTMADFDRLLQEAHRRGIRVLMDLVLNHTSDQHPWFLESRSSRRSAKRNWYLWADGKPSGPPSNWRSVFGGSAWTWDALTQQYYLHSFLKEQPDLNWANPDVRRAMFEVVQFWLDRGVDGFRLDAINWIGKDLRWTNNPRGRLALRSYLRQLPRYSRDRPETHQALKLLRAALKPYPDAVLVGEASSDTPGGPAAFYGAGNDELHLVFNFRLLKSPWRAGAVQEVVRAWDRAVPEEAWPTQVLSNHDQSRHWDRYGRGGDPQRRARAAAVLLLTLRGTPFLYYGEEIGMHDVRLKYRELRDPYTRRYWPFLKGRDRARTPMQWDATSSAGFTSGTPWLPVSPDWTAVNVAVSQQDRRSLLTLYRDLLALRKRSEALRLGSLQCLEDGPEDCLMFIRESRNSGDRVLVAINFSMQTLRCVGPRLKGRGRLLISSEADRARGPVDCADLVLGPDEAVAVKME